MPAEISRRIFLRGAAAAAVAGSVAAPLIAHGIHTHAFEQKRVRLTLGLNAPLRIAALGDIHFDPLYEEAYLENVVQAVTDLEPDIVAYTGDFLSWSPVRVHDVAAILSQAVARLGVFAILGNHDHYIGASLVAAALERRGIHVLRNSLFPLPGETNVFLTGLDSFWAGTPDAGIFARTPKDSRHIALVHEPDPFAQLTDPRLRLQISGHTHGGQIRAPMIGALVLPHLGRQFQAGLYERDGRWLYVNRGIGTLAPHLRYRCRPEITVFDLT